MIPSLDEQTFLSLLAQSDHDVLVDFWAPWCGPCRTQSQILDQLAGALPAQLALVKLNVDEHPQIARQYGIAGIPTLIRFRAGKVIERRVGVQSAQHLQDWLQPQHAAGPQPVR
jgi:thioredoxin